METQFHSWQEFIHMGGYGLYVWSAYGALALTFILGFFVQGTKSK